MSFSHRTNVFDGRDKSTRISGEQWSCRSNEEEGRLLHERSQTRPQKWFRVIHQLQLSHDVDTFLVLQATVKKQNMIKYKKNCEIQVESVCSKASGLYRSKRRSQPFQSRTQKKVCPATQSSDWTSSVQKTNASSPSQFTLLEWPKIQLSSCYPLTRWPDPIPHWQLKPGRALILDPIPSEATCQPG